eukprot:gnl/TRDRNA2_/TRDRNA2_155192_c0_seq3.p1 gnl/TRDRNA2_/TRDRNA2_155192_c0~~gnl/TRDRNA2_/TRDRNA2_155192_c0_seq3.p1  ORF type:complete len:416 (-),score=29.86 gnl/TRDRNA2_/TRDRNA2_155192_c0_seq3:78-1325(-)
MLMFMTISLTLGEALRLGTSPGRWAFSRSAAEQAAIQASSANPLPELSPLDGTKFHVPFYVYDELDWMSTTCSNGKVRKGVFQAGIPVKHTEDLWFMKAALNHTLRTRDPQQAELFVVPVLLNTAAEVVWRHKLKCCVDGLCNLDFFKYTNDMLGKSPWFQRNAGRDHVVVCSHYRCGGFFTYDNLRMCNSISHDENSIRGGRCRIASTRVGNRCDHKPKQFMFGMIASMHREKQTFHTRSDICRWMANSTEIDPTFNVSICGEGKQCPALAQSRFGFHVRGDEWGSGRLVDTILSGTVPMFTNPEQYKILPPYVPWKKISALINVDDKDTFRSSLKESVPHYDALKNAVDKYAPLVDWETPVPFEQYMWLFKQCASNVLDNHYTQPKSSAPTHSLPPHNPYASKMEMSKRRVVF